jgi:hypothetical protein
LLKALPHAAFSDSLVSGRRLLDRRELVDLHGAFGKAGGDFQFFAQGLSRNAAACPRTLAAGGGFGRKAIPLCSLRSRVLNDKDLGVVR